MTAVTILFYFFIFLAGSAAVAILFSKNVFKSALFLLVSLLSIAGLYVLSFAEFLAVTQILIYAGGITIIILFGIMLTTRISGKPLVVRNAHILSGGMAGIALFVLLIRYLPALPESEKNISPESIQVIGLAVFSKFSLPFEVAGILLLIALVGAAVITSQLKSKV
ncbi:MAG TPA: NADH-quinone oxidoreductase subunit J [Chryseosolibacter sp.]|jgi:NADH:ubiquinone oxidoreductase subunit 6 (chain J)